MDWESVIMGGACVFWGLILLFMRSRILEFSREGGKGLRNRKVINALLTAAIFMLPAAGIAVILTMGL